MRAFLLLAVLSSTTHIAHSCENVTEHIETMLADPYKQAAAYVLGNSCGTLTRKEIQNLKNQGDMLTNAGTRALPALIFLVQDSCSSPYLVSNIASYAVALPDSKELRTALRKRRTDPRFNQNTGWYSGLIEYFTKYGDDIDRAWIKSVATESWPPGKE